MNETFAQILWRYRKKQANLTQKQLALKSHISPEEISRLERDDTIKNAPMVIRNSTIEALARGLGLAEGGHDWQQFFQAAAERNRQKRTEKSGIGIPMEPVAGENPKGEIPLNRAYDLSQHQVLTSMENVANYAIAMLSQAANEKLDKVPDDQIRVTTMGASSIFLRLGREDHWDQAIRSVMQDRKWTVVSLYRMNEDPRRAIEVIQEIRNLSIYPSRFKPRYFRRVGETRPAYNLLIIPRIGALLCMSTHDSAVIDAAFYYPDTKEFAQHIRMLREHFSVMFTETDELARTYNRRSPEWEDTMTRICQLEADEFLANNSHDATTMPPDLFDEFLEKSLRREKSYSPMEFLSLKTHHIKRREAFERNVQSYTYRTIMPWRYFEEALGISKDAPGECRYLMAYAKGPDQYVTVDKSQAIAHMKHLVQGLRRYDNFEIALIEDHPSVEDLLYAPWLVKGELAVLTAIFTKSKAGQHPVFASEFEITETSIVRRYRERFLTLWGQVTEQNRTIQKENIIGKLTTLLEMAGSKL